MPGCKKRLDTRLFIVYGVALWVGNSPAWGQEKSAVESAPPATPPAGEAPPRPPPQSATAKLVQRLVERGLIDPAEAEALIAQAEAEARAANAQAESVKRVPYVPEVVKDQIRGELKKEVLEEAKNDNWAAPNLIPEWTKRLRFFGDARLRYEIDNMGRGNAVDYYPDFNAINSGKPFDVNFRDPSSERWLNTNRRRSRVRLRARFGAEANIGQGFFTELRLGSGDSATPVSLNQTLGGSGGFFSKYQFWLDRAAIRYEHVFGQAGLEVLFGRFENPFFRTDLIWDENVNFDGAALRTSMPLGGAFRSFFSAAVSPIFNTAFDFAAERPDKFKSIDKWLYAAQVGTEWRPAERFGLKLGVAYYFFDKAQGLVSSDCDTHIASITCDTDHTRPSFAQKGNTYRPLRTPSIAALDSEFIDGASRYQYFGLSSLFRELVATARLEVLAAAELKLGVDGEVVRNLGFRPSAIAADAVNNFKPCAADDAICRDNPPYGGGSLGYLGRLSLGTPRMDRRWNWNVAVTYRYLQSDATLDAFTNSEFALGGTNNKGFVAATALAIADNVILTARWLSSDVVVGPQYSIDVLHLDLMARY